MITEYQNLLTIKDDNTVIGPMSPVLFVNEMAKKLEFNVHGLCRVRFPDDTHQSTDEETGYDTLVVMENIGIKNVIL